MIWAPCQSRCRLGRNCGAVESSSPRGTFAFFFEAGERPSRLLASASSPTVPSLPCGSPGNPPPSSRFAQARFKTIAASRPRLRGEQVDIGGNPVALSLGIDRPAKLLPARKKVLVTVPEIRIICKKNQSAPFNA